MIRDGDRDIGLVELFEFRSLFSFEDSVIFGVNNRRVRNYFFLV